MEYKIALNLSCVGETCRNVFPNVLKKRNLTAILLILIQENGQSNATLISMGDTYAVEEI